MAAAAGVTRLDAPGRLAGIDLARGLAIVGMLAAHLLDERVAEAAPWTGIVDGRSSILFATLAGVSVGIVTGGRTPLTGERMRSARARLALRAGMLYLIGLALIATGVPVFVILPAYALLFLLSLPFTRLSARTLFLVAAGCAVTMPFVQAALDMLPWWGTPVGGDVSLLLGWHYPFPVWIAFVLAGMGLARTDLRDAMVQLRLVVAGAALTLTGYGLAAVSGTREHEEGASVWAATWTARPHSSGILEVIGSGGFAIAVIGVCLLLCRTPLRWLVLPLRAAGAMPLTAYVAQLVVWVIWAIAALGRTQDLAAFRALEPFWPITIGILLGCTAWALLIGRGPLEWLVGVVAGRAVPDRAVVPR
ncbi:DUF1624 domain-containing protein [Microbacterium sp. zg.Y1090]|uniref:DUF1624 domain-containing protein n=1 Tax=Microbacterium TaxID=33882 RepID=UPI00214CCA01|nr:MULTISPECIES: DUF1624 domain-containing protein [unclassified Microbacterium]MCR2813348.1 DUF1624 domain-containing protein [Microbacterium sp. zg.Y1084]MCR2818316.1 DUF1624 domain-containing protein [Microbacterium sp. zg.Y1090]MDL5488235.1 DUF1624 domain-containing protein [Microbacterium sp. zg-Y1211]WIM27542.1 DUF1624 domain-containing protein [Microbacterium sp. zg-Y1090]